MNFWIWLLIWFLSGTLTFSIILPYCIRATNKFLYPKEKIEIIHFIASYVAGPVGIIICPILTGLIILKNSENNFIERINKFWNLP